MLTDNIILGNSSNLTVNSTGNGSITFEGTIVGTASDAATDITVNAGSGNVTVQAIGHATKDIGDISLTGATVTLKGDVLTKAYTPEGGELDTGDFTIGGESALELFGADREIDTSDSNGGSVTIGGTIESADSNRALTIKSGGGAVDIAGIIGGTDTEHLGGLTINAESGAGTIAIAQIGDASDLGGVIGDVLIGNADTSQVNFDGTIYKINGDATITGEGGASDGTIDFTGGAATTFTTFNDTLKFVTGVIDLDADTNLTIATNGGALEIQGIRGDSEETVTLGVNNTEADASETIKIGTDGIGSANQIGTISVTAADGITIQGDIATSDSSVTDITFTGPVLIEGTVSIDSDDTDGNNDGAISFSSTIDSGESTGNLTILAGDTAG